MKKGRVTNLGEFLDEFDKTYFKASLAGLLGGYVSCLAALKFFGIAQPALLYIVPWQLGLTAVTMLSRGEFSEVIMFDEDTALGITPRAPTPQSRP